MLDGSVVRASDLMNRRPITVTPETTVLELEPAAHATTSYYDDEIPCSGADWVRMPDHFRIRMQKITAADAMSRDLVMVGPDAPLDEVVQALSTHRLHRVLVGEHGVLQGMITTFDLLPVLSRVIPRHGGSMHATGYSRGDFP